MISLSTAVSVVLWFIGAGIIFALLWMLLDYCDKEFPGAALFWKLGRVLLYLLAVLAIIGILLNFMADRPLFRP